MSFDIVFMANAANAVGAIGSIISFYFFSRDNHVLGYQLSIGASPFFIIGSLALESHPVVMLSSAWLLISLYGLRKTKSSATLSLRPLNPVSPVLPLFVLWVVSAWCYALIGEFTIAANYTVVGYLYFYLAMAANYISNRHYLALCGLISFALYPHLLEVSSYSVLAKEVICTVIGLCGGLQFLAPKKNEGSST